MECSVIDKFEGRNVSEEIACKYFNVIEYWSAHSDGY